MVKLQFTLTNTIQQYHIMGILLNINWSLCCELNVERFRVIPVRPNTIWLQSVWCMYSNLQKRKHMWQKINLGDLAVTD